MRQYLNTFALFSSEKITSEIFNSIFFTHTVEKDFGNYSIKLAMEWEHELDVQYVQK